MALYAFDGTWNENNPDDAKDTNVVKFHEAYAGPKWYVEGIGTRFWILGRLLGGFAGIGGRQRVAAAYAELEKRFRAGDELIDIVGFSRGAALALHFANEIHTRGVGGREEPPIRFVGLWDVVPSFGIPGNDINLGYALTLPASVRRCCHAMALDERRRFFPLQRVAMLVTDTDQVGEIRELWFRGVHSDVGGGNENLGLSSIPLCWMLEQAQRSGCPVEAARIAAAAERSDSAAAIGGVVDVIADPYRRVSKRDYVHSSVRPREGHNNPPVGARVVDDAGNVSERGFGQ